METSFEPSGMSSGVVDAQETYRSQRDLMRGLRPVPSSIETYSASTQSKGTNWTTDDKSSPSSTFISSISDYESGSSCGKDQFYLERYSQGVQNAQVSSRATEKNTIRTKKPVVSTSDAENRRLPGLNIVTNFSTPLLRSQNESIVVDQVQSQRPRIGKRCATSVVSAKAEHVDQTTINLALEHSMASNTTMTHTSGHDRNRAREAYSKWQDLQTARRKLSDEASAQRTASVADYDSLVTIDLGTAQRKDQSSEKRSVVIGLSLPSNEANAHRLRDAANDTHATTTPETPVIVITPAEEGDSWKPQSMRRLRPSSSIYSTRSGPHDTRSGETLPPVPAMPEVHKKGHIPVGEAITLQTAGYAKSGEEEDIAFDGERDFQNPESVQRASSESQEHILPKEGDMARHRSQGWWNLMLSPMLSRKGTISEKTRTNNFERPPMPPISTLDEVDKHASVSSVFAESPETPRRLGLASPRASISARWTFWAKSKGMERHLDRTDDVTSKVPKDQTFAGDAQREPPIESFGGAGVGLAAEYYHACAVEQLSGVRYFECNNHSCVERLPQLQSLFDHEAGENATALEVGAEKSLDDIKPNVSVEHRIKSLATVNSEQEELSPNVRDASTAPVTKAKAIEAPAAGTSTVVEAVPRDDSNNVGNRQEVTPSPLEQARTLNTSTARQNVQSPDDKSSIPREFIQAAVQSPGPISPVVQEAMRSYGDVPMSEMSHPRHAVQSPEQTKKQVENPTSEQTQVAASTLHHHTTYSERLITMPAPLSYETRENHQIYAVPATTNRHMSESTPPKPASLKRRNSGGPEKSGMVAKIKSLFKKKGAKTDEDLQPTKRKWTLIVGAFLLLIVIACILLATLLTRHGDETPTQSQWLNLTGYPPIPTGISTIAMPDPVQEQSQCVAPTTMWSCALPKENQAEIAPNSPDQPNFRFEITFKNGTVPGNMTLPVNELRKRSANLSPRASDPFTKDLLEPNPTPPSRADEIFLGNTTDNITEPFQGEDTPFFMTFIPVFPLDPFNSTQGNLATSKLLASRDSNNSDIIPAPDVLDDGSAAPANLLPTSPYPTSQPIKLYNRGQQDEHFGFYMYYDKAIFLRSTAPLNTSQFSNNNGIDAADEDGGCTRGQSRLRCTLSQTRFLVRIWTNHAFDGTLLSPIVSNTSMGAGNNSATDFNRPGSFPYPTTISLDRHGGNINKKAVYCYGVNDLQVIQNDVKGIVPELRGFGGHLINPAPPLVEEGSGSGNATAADDGFDPEAGGIDGGTGGCGCVWQNWN
ncbi:hypothetical protein PV08_01889 [Exophiala spinifera]|uniref:Glycoprotease family protein n=1 Tax=Exophiala spinifera TaxID=91928 RepID=A0A0D2CCT4_9EURO|nr:uncharacterized protein PV08_01889 [Exophiala spinifera]KIW21309.1 hypothetical protein PV08_01889 [Exophiala spinifera]